MVDEQILVELKAELASIKTEITNIKEDIAEIKRKLNVYNNFRLNTEKKFEKSKTDLIQKYVFLERDVKWAKRLAMANLAILVGLVLKLLLPYF